MSFFKKLERLGRLFLMALVSLLLGVRRRPVTLPEPPRILVVRLDERVGNLLLLVPLLDSLRLRFPRARIDLLGSVKGQTLLAGHPAFDGFLPFRKRALFAADGPLRTPFRLRHRKYDLAIDAANPIDPSATQAILVRLSGARHTVGADHPPFGRAFSAPAKIENPEAHEIDLRLALLGPLPGQGVSRRVFLPELPTLPPTSAIPSFLQTVERPFVVLNVGARVPDKMLPIATYVRLAELVAEAGNAPLITYGPGEAEVARAMIRDPWVLAPPTDLWQLAAIMQEARGVLTCDTGPMHVAVAVGTPTCGLFVSTEPSRFGYDDPPHTRVDTRERDADQWLSEVSAWLDGLGRS